MTAERVVDRAAERDQHDIADFARRVGDDPGEHDRHGHQLGRCAQHEAAHRRAQQAGFLRHADAEHRDQHHAERRERGEIVDQPGEDALQPLHVHQADRADHPVIGHARRACGPRIDHRDAHPAEQARQQHDAHRQQREQGDGVGQQVAQPFDAVEKAGKGVALRLGDSLGRILVCGRGKFGHRGSGRLAAWARERKGASGCALKSTWGTSPSSKAANRHERA